MFVFARTGIKSAIPKPSVSPATKVMKIRIKSLLPVYFQKTWKYLITLEIRGM
jgi:hypothetical protein